MRIDTEQLAKAFRELAKAVSAIFEEIVELCESINDVVESQGEQKNYRTTWHVPKDTRIKSQVMNNKPKFIVRKVIK
jgi:hypothetical protein